ncbi:MAG: isoamylase early set domain-containing protein [Pseudomonadota bacterium]
MPKKQEAKKLSKKRVRFTLEAPEAQKVILMGDFNNWNPKTHSMKKDDQGMWSKVVMLTPGNYEYKFLVDGDWRNDPHNDQTVPNCFGTFNNGLTVR